ncbi:hypothetical protein PMIN06_007674 [Paraphaeosphaeria minitans]|uniref:Uncharacterized protein n=1 Tax=Paraphaeosphaeria minitans TaxID=565426 RepID=A0A9P6GCB5_9PLEO|nr:hypothetical protein PMIN01_10767 [Paraphaeosphaeria minitans]
MDPNKHSQNAANWHNAYSRSTTSPSTSGGTSQQYQTIQPRPQSQPQGQAGQSVATATQFHHYQPPARPQQPPTARYPITAPFQVPRVPHPWPYAGANREQLGDKAGLIQEQGKGQGK